MNKFTKHTGKAVAIFEPNIDTDQIIPKQFLKSIGRTGFGKFLFYDRRFDTDGAPKADFVLNHPKFAGASVLLAGKNFGCGSSREHAPWALADFGFRVVIAPGFADIFYNNSLKTGLLPIALDESEIKKLVEKTNGRDDYEITVDLENRTVSDGEDFSAVFSIDDFSRYCLLNGLDDIGLTLQYAEKIRLFEENLPDWKKISNHA